MITMMTTKVYFLLAQRAGPFLYDLAWKSLAFVVLIGLAAFVVRRASAARRHLVWSVAVYGLLGMPLLTLMLPARRFSFPVAFAVIEKRVPNASASTTRTLREFASSVPTVGATPTGTFAAPTAEAEGLPSLVLRTHQQTAREFVPIAWPLWLTAVWGAGAMLVLLRTLRGLVMAARIRRECQRVGAGALADTARQVQSALGVARPLVLYLGVEKSVPAVPMTMGAWKPAILLPAHASEWTAARLQAVLLHEMAHVKRADWLTQMAALLVCAVYWFNPFVWLVARRLRAESEHACDDLVLSVGVRACDYAQHLLAIARGVRGRQFSPTLLTMARRPEVRTRLEAILEMNRNRQPCTARTLLGALILAVGVLSPLAVWQTPTQAQTSQQTFSTTGTHVVASSSKITPVAGQAPGRPPAKPGRGSSWRTTMPDGVQVQLERVEGWLADGKAGWWQPDGSGLTAHQITDPTLKPGERRLFARLTFPPRSFPSHEAILRSYITFGVQGGNGYSVGTSEVVDADGQKRDSFVTTFSDVFPTTQQQVTMTLNIAAGTPPTIISGPPQHATTRHLESGETALLSRAYTGTGRSQGHQIAIHGVKVILPSRYFKNSNYNLTYLDHSGKEHSFQYSSANIPDTSGKQAEVRFDFRASEVPLSQIKTFLFRSQPIHTVLFRNVALQPTADGIHAPQPQ